MGGSSRRYVALLRGINVGGKSVMRMADLREKLAGLGLEDVSTYIQTGNVLFTAAETDADLLAQRIEEKLKTSLGYQGKVFVLTPEELAEAADNNPFTPERLEHEQRCHLMFLDAKPDAERRKKLMAMAGEEYRFSVQGKVFYYAYPKAFEGAARRSIDFERVLGTAGTARTWKVVAKLIELAQ